MALQGGFDFNHDSGLFAGYWASSTNFAAVTPEPVRAAAGARPTLQHAR
jgi:hypothetical protein